MFFIRGSGVPKWDEFQKVDFFKGEYIADKLKKEIEKKLNIKKKI